MDTYKHRQGALLCPHRMCHSSSLEALLTNCRSGRGKIVALARVGAAGKIIGGLAAKYHRDRYAGGFPTDIRTKRNAAAIFQYVQTLPIGVSGTTYGVE